MAYVVYSVNSLSTAANTKTSDLITGVNQNIPPGTIKMFAKGSATGMNISLAVNGVPLVDDLPITSFGTAGTLSTNDNAMVEQKVSGGRVTLFLRNTTGGALTSDVLIVHTPGK